MARRRYGPRPPGRLELGAADLVLSGDGSLAAAPAEIAALDGLLRGRGLAARRIGDLPSLLQTFQRGDVGLLHFSCHNAFARGAPNASRILLGNQPFEPVFLEAHAGRFAAPLVFLNACRTPLCQTRLRHRSERNLRLSRARQESPRRDYDLDRHAVGRSRARWCRGLRQGAAGRAAEAAGLHRGVQGPDRAGVRPAADRARARCAAAPGRAVQLAYH